MSFSEGSRLRVSSSHSLVSTPAALQEAKSNNWPDPVIRELYDPEQVELTMFLGSTTTTTQKTREKILNIIKVDNTVSIEELASQVGITVKGVEWQLANLKSQGRLKRVGAANGGHWEVIDGNREQ